MGKGVVDENDATSLGLLGMFGTPYANKIIQDNDFFFAIGVRWGRPRGRESRVRHPCENRVQSTSIRKRSSRFATNGTRNSSFIGDAATALDDLTDYAERKAIAIGIDTWRQHATRLKRTWPLDYRRDGELIQQAEVLDRLNALIAETRSSLRAWATTSFWPRNTCV